MKKNTKQLSKSSMKYYLVLLITLCTLFAWEPVQAEEPVIRAVLFYSPSCGHCQEVITEVLPPIQEKLGDRLIVLGIDVSYAEGQDLYQAAVRHYQIPEDRLGVPTMIVGDTILVGSQEIPESFEQLAEQTLQNGGTDWPDVPGLKEKIAAIEETAPAAAASAASQAQTTPAAESSVEQSQLEGEDADPQPLWMQKFLLDPLANSVAVLLLVVMIVGVIASVILVLKPLSPGSQQEQKPWLIPALVLVGVFIASYMTYVEVTKNDAICGPLGDCNAVQQSSYAVLFGILPVGIFGLLGYLAIGAAWMLQRFGPRHLKNISGLSMWGMALFGVVFSIYLTFLEPFVIGATCIWCISSAVVVSLLLAVTTNYARSVEEYEEDEIDIPDDA
jgi:uncharacterized membrane protein/thiol-disulfide isomerase/thioredoxin